MFHACSRSSRWWLPLLAAFVTLALPISAFSGGAGEAAVPAGSTIPGEKSLTAESQPAASSSEWFATATLEELMQVRITSAGRKEQPLSEVPAAVFVVSREDIRRSGAATVPEALRMVPGLHVAQIDASKWAISARGFSGRFANKMLVLIDGRTIYTNLYSAVNWDQNELMMEDIERIEVVRGPGATLWGVNAVNGVINIVTRSAEHTEGGLVSVRSGLTEPLDLGLRYGGRVGKNFHYRFFGKAYSRGPQLSSLPGDPGRAYDVWFGRHLAMRADWSVTDRDEVSMQASVHRSEGDQTFDIDFINRTPEATRLNTVGMSGGFGMLRWKRNISPKSEIALLSYFTHEKRNEFYGQAQFQAAEVDFQHRYRFAKRHDLLWGAGYRLYRDRIGGPNTQAGVLEPILVPATSNDSLYNTFVQDEIALVPSRLILTVGTKLQHNRYTGMEFQPNVRLLWAPTRATTMWSAVSRAARTPARRDLAVRAQFDAPAPAPMGSLIRLFGDPNIPSEHVLSYEAGVRRSFGPRFSVDAAAFFSKYTDLQRLVQLPPQLEFNPFLAVIFPFTITHGEKATYRGVEVATTWVPSSEWTFGANYSYVAADNYLHGFRPIKENLRSDPAHQWQLRTSWDVTPKLSLDAWGYYQSSLQFQRLPSHWRTDLRMAWKFSESAELNVLGQNLNNSKLLEYVSEDFVRSSYLRRNVRLNLVFNW